MVESEPSDQGRLGFKIDSPVPHPARVWNFWLGGKAKLSLRQPGR
jgi:hypothetical protein